MCCNYAKEFYARLNISDGLDKGIQNNFLGIPFGKCLNNDQENRKELLMVVVHMLIEILRKKINPPNS